jgi:dGTPase
LKSSSGRTEVVEVAQKWYGSDFAKDELDAALVRVGSLPSWPASFDGTMRSLGELKNLTSTLIGRFCISAQQATQAEYGQRPVTRYEASLVVPAEARYEVTALKALAARFVMNRAGATEQYARQRQQIQDLVEFLNRDPEVNLDRFHTDLWLEADSAEAKFRVVIDQVAALTDVSLVQWHQRNCT